MLTSSASPHGGINIGMAISHDEFSTIGGDQTSYSVRSPKIFYAVSWPELAFTWLLVIILFNFKKIRRLIYLQAYVE